MVELKDETFVNEFWVTEVKILSDTALVCFLGERESTHYSPEDGRMIVDAIRHNSRALIEAYRERQMSYKALDTKKIDALIADVHKFKKEHPGKAYMIDPAKMLGILNDYKQASVSIQKRRLAEQSRIATNYKNK